MRNIHVKYILILLGLKLAGGSTLAQSFSDMFAGSQLFTGAAATLTGSNINASVEPGEPRHADKIGGHSVWISWQAPANGLVTLSTAGSSFDTLLAVYVLEPGNGSPFPRLEAVAEDDDYGGQETSYVQFGTTANQIYQIAVDGFNGATGNISFQLNFLSSSNLQPTVVSRTGDQALRLGDPLILTLGVIPTTAQLDLQWYLNGNRISDASEPTLLIPSLQRTNLGLYSLRFELNDDSFFSSTIEIQVNSEGQNQVLARNKIADAALSGLTPNATQSGLSGGVVLGYNGTQIFNTTNAVVDTNAPLVCGVPPGAAYWFSYQAPTNGIMTIDTGNSSFATLLAVFTYTGVLTSYTNLVPVACDNNSGGTGTNTSQVSFVTTNGGNYFIVVGGVNGARGIAHLNYSLSAGLPPTPPVLTSSPLPLLASANTAVAFSAVAGGTAPLSYQWWKNNSRLRQQTNASLLFAQPASQDTANYFVVVTNMAGAVTSAPASLTVIGSAVVNLNAASNTLVSAFPGIRGYQYSVDYTAGLAAGVWVHFTNAFPDYGGLIWVTNSTASFGSLLLRVHTP
jgi:hypothetical protein